MRSRMKTHVPGLLAAFLGGVLATSLWMMRDAVSPLGSGANAASSNAVHSVGAPTETAQAAGSRARSAGGSPATEQTTSLALERMAVPTHDALAQKLAAIIAAPVDERMSRLAIFFAELRHDPARSTALIRDYLRTGQDLKIAAILGSEMGPLGRRETTRTSLVELLFQINAKNPAVSEACAREMLGSFNAMPEIALVAKAMNDLELGNRLQPSLEGAVHRALLSTPQPDVGGALHLATTLRSASLLRDALSFAGQNPQSILLPLFLNDAWNLPDDLRLEATRSLLGQERFRKQMPPWAYLSLDVRVPEFRQIVVDSFRATEDESSRTGLLGRLTDADNAPEGFKARQGDKFPPSTGAPGGPEQTAAQLQLLDELAPYCDTEVLKQYLAEARAALQATLDHP
jgi:hypothetical protein